MTELDYDYYADNHRCRRCGDRLDEDHSCNATDYGVGLDEEER